MITLKKISILCCGIMLFLPAIIGAVPYTGNGPGSSTIGTGGDYPSLFDATMAINNQALTGGDWTFLILNDLTETNNSVFGAPELSSHTITFRPAPGTQPTVTFTTSTAPLYGSRGHIAVGFSTATLNTFTPRPIHNVVFDGCNMPGGTTCDLLLTNISTPAGCAGIFDIRGDCDNVHIRNCRMSAYAPTLDFSPVTGSKIVAFNGYYNSGYYVPDHSSIENCDIVSSTPSHAVISCASNTGTPSGHSSGNQVLNNRLNGQMLYGIQLGAVSNCLVTSNSIDMTIVGIATPGAIVSASAINYIGSLLSPNDSSMENQREVEISSNRIRFLDANAAQAYLSGITVNTRHTYSDLLISNNSISGLSPEVIPGMQYNNTIRQGITIGNFPTPNVPVHASIINNSISLTTGSPTLMVQASTLTGIYIRNSGGQFHLTHNIIRNDIYLSPCITIMAGNVTSNYNNFARSGGANTAWYYTGSGYTGSETLADWQTYSGQDMNSISQDPFVESEPDAGLWVGPAGSLHPDMHFTSHPGDAYRVPRHPDVLTDLDGTPRPANDTIMGAYQPPDPTSSVGHWMLY